MLGALEKEMDHTIFLGDDVGDDDASPQWMAEEAECMICVNHEDETNDFFVCCWRCCNRLTVDRHSTKVSFEESLSKWPPSWNLNLPIPIRTIKRRPSIAPSTWPNVICSVAMGKQMQVY